MKYIFKCYTKGMIYPFKGNYKISGNFGQTGGPYGSNPHQGVDFAMPSNTPIYAADGGRVVSQGFHSRNGNNISIQTGDLNHRYFHLNDILVKNNQVVNKGDLIGRSGSTGYSTGPHLHFQVEKNGVPVNPLPYLNNADIKPVNTPQLPNSGNTYTIKPGDTFWGLETAWGLKHGTLQALNPKIQPKALKIGQKIIVSSTSASSPKTAIQYYIVKPGDTFWALERAWKLPAGRLQSLNPGVNPKLLQIGQKIRKQ